MTCLAKGKCIISFRKSQGGEQQNEEKTEQIIATLKAQLFDFIKTTKKKSNNFDRQNYITGGRLAWLHSSKRTDRHFTKSEWGERLSNHRHRNAQREHKRRAAETVEHKEVCLPVLRHERQSDKGSTYYVYGLRQANGGRDMGTLISVILVCVFFPPARLLFLFLLVSFLHDFIKRR